MSLCPSMIPSRRSTDERETQMTTHQAATAFINALIVRFRASVTTGTQLPGIQHVHIRARPLVDPVLIPTYRRRGLPRRGP
jgi:hypothetical protein